jgi:radical SAM superfamily enzyme YgiQ (UPF0313 family)
MKKGRILLITPNLKGVKDGLNRIQPSLGLMTIAQNLLDNNHIVKIHDSALEGWNNKIDLGNDKVMIGQSDQEIENVIREFNPDIVGVSILFSNLNDSAHIIAGIVKKINPKIYVLLGGNHISNSIVDYKENIIHPGDDIPLIKDMEDDNVDFALIGEADFTIIELVNKLINKEDYSKVPGLLIKVSRGKYLDNPPGKSTDLINLPIPARHLVNMEAYFDIGAFHSAKSRSNRVLNIMCSRGCPEKCTFCTTPQMWGATVRWRQMEHIMKEIKEGIERFDIGEIQFEDDTITARKKNLIDLCNGLEKIGLPWCTPNGIKTNYHLASQPDMFKAMYESGCYQVTLACESGVQRVLDNVVNKRLKVDQIVPAIQNAKKVGLLVHTFWILGYPGETYEEMQQTIDVAMNSGADSFSFSILSPLPGTPIYRKVIRENLWWPGRTLSDLMYRSSLVKVDGFSNPKEFENFVNEANIKANLMLKQNDPKRFIQKYGQDAHEKSFVKQT